ncbi:hypothetical protein Goshw_007345 [Gossypium schwendimanii]|uniref:Uncharacterized protein n=1 Tax=Gossypium schwendimanii TaxID=34291 RepID=A0A7J9KQQ6_GOSSC|nr:hypothetical protein [Gossypium schwendimanii]
MDPTLICSIALINPKGFGQKALKPPQAESSNSFEDLLKAYMAKNDTLIQSQAATLKNLENQMEVLFKKFLDFLKRLHINIPLVEALEQMANYVKFMKDIFSKKKQLSEYEIVALTKECSLGIVEVRPTTVTVQLADCSLAYPEGKIDDVFKGELTMPVQDDKVTFNVLKAMKFPDLTDECLVMEELETLVSTKWESNFEEDPLENISGSKTFEDKKGNENMALMEANPRSYIQPLQFESLKVSPVQCVLKKGGIMIAENERNKQKFSILIQKLDSFGGHYNYLFRFVKNYKFWHNIMIPSVEFQENNIDRYLLQLQPYTFVREQGFDPLMRN